MKKLHILVLAGALLAIAAGVGYAAIPSADGTISACKNSKGALKVIDAEAGQGCPDGQQLLSWNQQGQPGPQGIPGISGYEVLSAESGAAQTPHRGMQLLCPSGKKALGGGGAFLTADEVDNPTEHPHAYIDRPLIGGAGWDFRAFWPFAGFAWKVRAYVICATVEP